MRTSLVLPTLLLALGAQAQVVGDEVVCPGRIHTYTATVPGAVAYSWTYPAGWYHVSGADSVSFTATCNLNAGLVCVTATDALGAVIGTYCTNTEMGGGTHGMTVYPTAISGCLLAPLEVDVLLTDPVPGCPLCGGAQAPNIDYAFYDDDDASANFLGFMGGVPTPATDHPVVYVRLIDFTAGTAVGEAVFLQGGCSALQESVVQVTINYLQNAQFEQVPAEVCVGEEVEIWEVSFNAQVGTEEWFQPVGLQVLSPLTSNPITAIVTATDAQIGFQALGTGGCPMVFFHYVDYCVSTNLDNAARTSLALLPDGDAHYRIQSALPLQRVTLFALSGVALSTSRSSAVDLAPLAEGAYVVEAIDTAGERQRWRVVR